MDTLDFGEIMNQNECWFENYDISCPFCEGTGEITVYHATCLEEEDDDGEIEGCGHEWEVSSADHDHDHDIDVDIPEYCLKCSNDNIDVTEETRSCEKCNDGMFDVMWNTAFGIDVRNNDENTRKFAWDMGFCLITHGPHSDYLLMGSCGADMTWRIHYTRWKIQGYLNLDDIYDCMHSGGYCFLSDKEKNEMCEYFKEKLPTPESYAENYKREMQSIDKIAAVTRGII